MGGYDYFGVAGILVENSATGGMRGPSTQRKGVVGCSEGGGLASTSR